MTWEPNKPSIVATRKNMLKPPPKAIERLLLSNQQEVKKLIPEMANNVMKAPRFNKINSPYVSSVTDGSTKAKHMQLVIVVAHIIKNKEPIK